MCHKETEVTELLCSLSWTQRWAEALARGSVNLSALMAKVSLNTLPTVLLWPFLHYASCIVGLGEGKGILMLLNSWCGGVPGGVWWCPGPGAQLLLPHAILIGRRCVQPAEGKEGAVAPS